MALSLSAFSRTNAAAAVFVLVGGSVATSLTTIACSDDTPDATTAPPIVEAGPAEEAAAPGDAGVASDASKCEPQRIPGFAPVFGKPAAAHSGRCGPGQVNAILDGCLNNPMREPCDAAFAAAPDCAACLFGPLAAEPAPPIVEFDRPSFIDRNNWACVAMLTGDSSEGSCARKVAASFQCGTASC